MEEMQIVYYNRLAMRAVTDESAFNELYEFFFPRVYNYVFGQLKNAAAADDVTSETFIKAIRSLDSYDSARAAFSTWLFRIAKNTLINYTKWRSYRLDAEWDDNLSPTAPATETPEARAVASETNTELLAALRELSEREQEIIELRYWSDMPSKEIAAMLDMTVSNLNVTLHRAMGKLKKILGTPED